MITNDLLPMLDDPTFSDEDLAKLADVPVAEVAAARAKKAALLAALEPPAAKPTRAPRAKPTEPAPAPAPETAEAAELAPAAVRVATRNGSVTTPHGVVDLRPGLVYRGPTAKFLWTHHRHLVEPYGA